MIVKKHHDIRDLIDEYLPTRNFEWFFYTRTPDGPQRLGSVFAPTLPAAEQMAQARWPDQDPYLSYGVAVGRVGANTDPNRCGPSGVRV